MGGAAVVGNQDIGQGVEDEQFPQRGFPGHIYDAGTALEIYNRISNVYFKEFELLRDELNKMISK